MGTLNEHNPSVWVETTRTDVTSAADGSPTGTYDVVVVGAGITGLSSALLLAESGARVALLEAGQVCSGVTAYTTAKVTSLHGLKYDGLVRHRGKEIAQAYADANQAAIAQIAAWIDRYGIACDFSRRPAYTYTTDPSRVADIEAEVEAATALGLPVTFTNETELPYDVEAAIRLDDQAQFHPRRYCLGLAAAFTSLGGQIFEDTTVTGVNDGSPVEVHVGHDRVRAEHVVLATHLPILDRGLFFAKTHPARSYAMTVRLKDGAPPNGMYLSADQPTRSVRSAEGDSLLILGGEGHKVGQDPVTRNRYAALEDWARAEWQVDEIVHRWSAQDHVSGDGLPYIGRQLPGSRVFVGTGYGKWGMTNGTAAAGIIADRLADKDNEWAVAFRASRLAGPFTSKETYKENIDAVGGHLIGDRLKTLNPPDADTLAPGEGGIVKLDGDKVAAYRHEDGSLTAVSPVCRHVGCLVSFNTAERSWDCPCHGSRYTLDGKVIQGPSVHDLENKSPT
jgi:glycine/D-amino acid oxidase-like deaminating enzyme/nitrite reductase/ring-hydroxylating ferredoxin subunit